MAILAGSQFAVKQYTKLSVWYTASEKARERARMESDHVSEQNSQNVSKSLAEKIDHLFTTIRPPGGGEFTFEQVAEAISQRGEMKLTPVYVSQLRRGKSKNPTVSVLEELARFFGVSPAYFFDSKLDSQIEAELALLTAMRNASVREIALRAAELSPESLRNLATLIDHWSQLERGKTKAN